MYATTKSKGQKRIGALRLVLPVLYYVVSNADIAPFERIQPQFKFI